MAHATYTITRTYPLVAESGVRILYTEGEGIICFRDGLNRIYLSLNAIGPLIDALNHITTTTQVPTQKERQNA